MKRPSGCFFDAYGYAKPGNEELTCENCPLSPMICDYKGYSAIERLARIISGQSEVKIISDP
ncbi:MAG: hypothetical protein ACPLM9_02590 [Methanomassiliicoccales archaeon]